MPSESVSHCWDLSLRYVSISLICLSILSLSFWVVAFAYWSFNSSYCWNCCSIYERSSSLYPAANPPAAKFLKNDPQDKVLCAVCSAEKYWYSLLSSTSFFIVATNSLFTSFCASFLLCSNKSCWRFNSAFVSLSLSSSSLSTKVKLSFASNSTIRWVAVSNSLWIDCNFDSNSSYLDFKSSSFCLCSSSDTVNKSYALVIP